MKRKQDQYAVLSKITELNRHIRTIEEQINEMKPEDPKIRSSLGAARINQKFTKFFNLLPQFYEQQLQVRTLKEENIDRNEDKDQEEQDLKRRIIDSEEKLNKMKEEALNLNFTFKNLEDLIEKFNPTTFHKDENWFDYNLHPYASSWGEISEKGRNKGLISFMEVVNYKPLWSSGRFIGIKLSQLLIDFLMLSHFYYSVRPLIWRVEIILINLRMETKPVLIKTFVDVLEEVDERYWNIHWELTYPEPPPYPRFLGNSFTKTEKDIGIRILREVLYCVFCFCCPFLPMMHLNTGTLDAFASYLRARVSQKVTTLGMEINKVKKENPPLQEKHLAFRGRMKREFYKKAETIWADQVKEPS